MVEVGEPKSPPLNQFDFVVDTFCKRIRPAFDKVTVSPLQKAVL